MLLLFGVGVLCWVLVLCVFLCVLSSLAITLLKKRLLVALLQLCCGSLCFASLPHGAVDWSAICDCGISWSYYTYFLII